MKNFVNAEVVELNIEATADYAPEAESYDGVRQADGTIIAKHGVAFPSGGKDAVDFYVK